MQKKGNSLISYVVSILGFGVLFVMLEFFYLRVSPHQTWFNYVDIIPAQHTYTVGEYPYFISYAEIKRTSDITRVDVLYCDLYNGLGYTYYTVYNSENKNVEPRPLRAKPWRFVGRGPLEPSTCYLEANISVLLPYGLKKTQTVVTSEFLFVEDKKQTDLNPNQYTGLQNH